MLMLLVGQIWFAGCSKSCILSLAILRRGVATNWNSSLGNNYIRFQ